HRSGQLHTHPHTDTTQAWTTTHTSSHRHNTGLDNYTHILTQTHHRSGQQHTHPHTDTTQPWTTTHTSSHRHNTGLDNYTHILTQTQHRPGQLHTPATNTQPLSLCQCGNKMLSGISTVAFHE